MSGLPVSSVPVSEGVEIVSCPCSRVVRARKITASRGAGLEVQAADWEHLCPACGRELVLRLVPPAEPPVVRSAG